MQMPRVKSVQLRDTMLFLLLMLNKQIFSIRLMPSFVYVYTFFFNLPCEVGLKFKIMLMIYRQIQKEQEQELAELQKSWIDLRFLLHFIYNKELSTQTNSCGGHESQSADQCSVGKAKELIERYTIGHASGNECHL